MSFDQFLIIVKARWKLALAIFLLIVIGTGVATSIWPKSYTATASVMVDTRPDPVSMSPMNMGTATSFVATQVDIISSPRIAQYAAKLIGLDKSTQMQERWSAESHGKGDYLAWIADTLAKNLSVKPSRESNVIEISYEGSDPQFASGMANAFARAYIESSTLLRMGPARQYAEFFEERARLSKEKLERAQAKLAEAQKEKDILATDERLDVEAARLSELSQQLLALKALRVESTNRNRQTSISPDQSADVLNSSTVIGLKSQLATQEAALGQLSERLGENHPQVVEIKATIRSLRDRVASETNRVARSLGNVNTVNTARESAAQAAFDEQRARVMRLKEERSKLALLEREVDSALRVYEAIQMRQSQTNLEGSNSQPNAVMLSPATDPAKPSSPRTMLNMILATVLGALLSLIAVLGLEMSDRRVRSGFDIMDTVELPVLGVLPAPNAGPKQLGLFKKSAKPQTFHALTSSTKRADSV